ncbi:Gfo/Idh/MocA family protein [Paenibacillus nasutitermitis]|uniref:Glycosyl hydrolase family 109 protein 2 n=1 Tax=Paenibacillus nasutitermitis TaxID=1652958 RepID=A0A916ZHM1_9BACL|nr:Gfo/Idh/MocA family oxidoreductase [Paenibacillus nasutitermitis]GGD98430.1 glycosyl hydrolase family 109 protein 2 [Paenibacillus nasutitermitis]
MANKKVRLGVIGTGIRGIYVAQLYRKHPDCEVVALCDSIRNNVERAAAELGVPVANCYTDYEKMISNETIDAVLIAAPPDIQVDIACYAMEKGIHVTTEVPAAYSIEQCWKLVHTVEKTGAKYQLSEQTRYWGFIQEWRRMAAQGEFGHILFAEGEYLHYGEWDYFFDPLTGEKISGIATPPQDRKVEPTWRNIRFYNPIYYLPHTLSPLLSITGGRVTKVSCMGTRPRSYYVDNYEARDMEVALMHTSTDAILRVAAGFTSPHGHRKDTGYHWYQVKGTEATAEWARSSEDKPKLWTANDDTWRNMDWEVTAADISEFEEHSAHGNADSWPVHNFLKAILEDKELEMNVYTAVETAAPAILAAESSNKGGILLEVPDFRRKES